MTNKVVTVIGARPQFIKAAAVSRVFKKTKNIQEVIVHTGQHFDENMSSIFFEQLAIPSPTYNLNINGTSHGEMTGQMMVGLEKVFVKEKPDAVIVYGDTNSTLAASLAAAKIHIPVVHIEAGLRSFNKSMPEEINRILTDHVSSILFCPTQESVDNLKKEGLQNIGHYHSGDVMYDATLYALDYIKKHPESFNLSDIKSKKYVLLTIHRAHSTRSTESLKEMILYVDSIAEKNDLQVVFPVHPRTKSLLGNITLSSRFKCISPVGYFEMQYLLKDATYVLTDSGGVQKEAYFHKVPCITLREDTEWVETINNGWNKLWRQESYKPRKDIADYGTGHAAENIVRQIEKFLNES